ncbi:MAG TPA: protein-disulfide reductase DsbD domain-containing protein, partial [Chthoniobacteraceae bacterium]|nr:protein-disulfide reductase DsbD domain-containing protein [Chthoniobacteraceae bacterium]
MATTQGQRDSQTSFCGDARLLRWGQRTLQQPADASVFAAGSDNVVDSAMPRRFLLFLLACFAAFATPLGAQTYEGEQLVDASLVADTDTIVPGKPFTVGLLMKTEPGWHTYWEYPGDAGFPTKIEWNLPPGFKAGAIQWPLPQKEDDEGGLQSYVYKDEVLLMVTITPPDKIDAKQITLAGKASWLVCEKICVPGKADLSLALPVENAQEDITMERKQTKPANADLFAKYRALLPVIGDKNFTYSWNNSKDTAELGFHDALFEWNTMIRSAKPGEPNGFDFFPLPAPGMTIEHPAPVAGLHTTIKIDSGDPSQLSGVVVYYDGASPKGWFVPPQKAAPSAPATSSTAAPGGATNTAGAPPAQGSLLQYLLLGFFGGMLLNIMPCVLPVITLKIYGFINQAGQSRARIFQLGLAYCAGVFA